MCPKFVTQLVEELPRVLIFSKRNSFLQLVAGFLERQGLQAEVADLSKFSKEKVDSSLDKGFYKVLVLVDEKSKEIEQIQANLIENSRLQVVLTVSSLSKIPFLSKDNEFSLIVGLDVIPGKDVMWPVFELITQKISLGKIIDPQIDVFLQSESDFFQEIKKELLSPQKQKKLVKGKKQTTKAVVSEVSRLYGLFYDLELDKEIVKFSSFQPQEVFFDEISETDSTLPSLLEKSVRQLSSRIKKIEIKPEIKFHDQQLNKPQEFVRKTTVNIPQKTQKVSQKLPTTERHSKLSRITKDKERLKSFRQPQKELVNLIQVNQSISPKKTSKKVVRKPDPTVDEKLAHIFQTDRVEEKTQRVEKILKKTTQIKKKTKKKKFLFVVSLIMTFLGVGVVIFFGLFWRTNQKLKKELYSELEKIESSDYETFYSVLRGVGESSLKSAKSQQEKFISIISPLINLNGDFSFLYNAYTTKNLISYADYGAEVFSQEISLVSSLLGGFKGDVFIQRKNGLQEVSQSYTTLIQLIDDLEGIKYKEKNLERQELLSNLIEKLEKQKKSLIAHQQLYPVLDEMLGEKGKRNYAVVLQNNQELRPTGGFIQAVALITVDQGMIIDSQVFSSYELDEMLGGSVVPPDEIIDLLGENKWYLRDSNWNPDFKKSGEQIGWFLEQQLNKKVDGVLAMNLYVLEDLLKAVGPLELEEYNEVLTDKNLAERMEFHSEVKLVNSDEVDDYSVEVMRYLLAATMNKGPENALELLASTRDSFEEKNLLAYFKNSDLQQTFAMLGWTGEIVVPDCPAQLSTVPCQVDPLVVVDTNIGINKANYHTEREDSHQIEIGKDVVTHTRTIDLNNTAIVNAWPKGSYKSYWRFFLPPSSTGMSLQVDGKNVPESKMKIVQEASYIQVGMVLEVPIKSKSQIELRYSVPLEVSLPYSYSFFNQKQPGTKDVLPQVNVSFQPSLSPTLIAPQAEVQGSSILFNDLEDDHAFVGVSFE